MILRPSHHHNLSSHNPNRNVNFCLSRLHQSASCCQCSRIRILMACTTAPMDRCQIIIIIITQPITTTPRRQDHRRSGVQMELMSVTWRIKILSVSCAVTRVPVNTTDSSHAKVSWRLITAFSDHWSARENPFNVINLCSPLFWTHKMQFEVHLNNFSVLTSNRSVKMSKFVN